MLKIHTVMMGLALMLIMTPSVAMAEAGIAAFFGTWKGSGLSESEVSSNFHMSVRDLEVIVKSAGSGGFEITWSTVQRQKGDPKNPTEVVKGTTLALMPSGNGMWRAGDGDPMADGQLAWARIEDNTLILSTFRVTEDGHGEYQVYKRTLNGMGMELDFSRIVDGEQVRTAKARLTKFSN